MVDKTFVLTIEQIKDIYRAGINRGHEEECSFQWGSRTQGNQYSGCIDVMYDILNENKNSVDHPDFIDYSVVE